MFDNYRFLYDFFQTIPLTRVLKSVIIAFVSYRGVAQLVAHTSGGRDAAGSSPVTPTK